MQKMEDNSVDMILCDLPYWTTKNKWDTIIPLDKLWKEYKRIIKERWIIALFWQTPFDKILWCSNLKMLKYEWIWEKTTATWHLNAKRMPMKAHENILIFYKKLPTYNFQKTFWNKRKISKSESKINSKESDNYNKNQTLTSYNSTERYPRSVLVFPTDKQKSSLHPTQKPIKLLEYFIKTYSNKWDIVLDNCMWSWSTGVACKNLNRKFIWIELDEKYFKIAENRINNIN
jgi:site-specific DNA-methyltransferase (adenine-specific)